MKDPKLLFKAAESAMQNAYAPYSQFLVGACIESENGELYAGCNIENASYSLTICAEACAICAMISAGETKIVQIAVMTISSELTAPCGACRQRIHEFAAPDTLVHIGNLEGRQASYRLEELLPHAFGKNDLEKAKQGG